MKKTFSFIFCAMLGIGAMAQSANDKTIDICKKNSSDSYETYNTATSIPAGSTLTVRTSRYTQFYPTLTGSGNLALYCGGERTFLGTKDNKTQPDWSGFTGNVDIYPYKAVEANAGWYGAVMVTRGKSFSPEDLTPETKINSLFSNNKVMLHDGATIATEKSAAGVRFGELNTDKGSQLFGYYKSQSTATTAHYLLGALNTDATLAGRISSTGNDVKQAVGIIKEGTGTYTITGNDNSITGGLRVKKGTVLICNDMAAAKSGRKTGATGAAADATMPVAYVFGEGILGGTGNVGGGVDLYGTIAPGVNGNGTLTLQNFATSKVCNLTVHPASVINCSITSAEQFSSLNINGQIIRSNITEDFSESSASPRIVVSLAEENSVKVGDSFQLVHASKGRENAGLWFFKVVLPSKYTWKVEDGLGDDGSYSLSVTCTSLETGNNDENQNDNDDDEKGGDNDDAGGDVDDTNVASDLFLRQYLEMNPESDKRIGVAIPSNWTFNVTASPSAKESLAITNNFNLCVPENEMKMEFMQPSQGTFDFNYCNSLINYVRRAHMDLRGHTLCWHSQVPSWISSDGKKNDKGWTRQQLLDILKAHITRVVKYFKGTARGVVEWDVVNETLDDDQSIVRTNPNGYKLREESVWVKVIGEDFIDSAFVWAHEANPDALLYLNDYGCEYNGGAKTTALYNLARRLKQSGIPIDGVGLQCHLKAADFNKIALNTTVKKYEMAGLNCILTEIDFGIYTTSKEDLMQQKKAYKEITEVFLARPNCPHMIIWGINDRFSWISDQNALLFDNNTNPKPAYEGVREALRNYVATSIKDIDNGNGASVKSTSYFTLDGRAVSTPQPGICIERTTLSDGSVKAKKVLF